MSEVSLCSAFAVVYHLKKAQWLVAGRGWAEIHLYRDEQDGTHRIVGWTVSQQKVVINVSITGKCQYKQKTDDFHKLTDERKRVYGFGFSQLDNSCAKAHLFLEGVLNVIRMSAPSLTIADKSAKPIRPSRPLGIAESLRRKSGFTIHELSKISIDAIPTPAQPAGAISALRQHDRSLSPSSQSSPRPPPQQCLPVPSRRIPLPSPPPLSSRISIAAPDMHSEEKSDYLDEYPTGIPLGQLSIKVPKPAKEYSAFEAAITDPLSITHTQHVEYDPSTGNFSGLPAEWAASLSKQFGIPLSQIQGIKLDGYASKIPNILILLKKQLFELNGHLQEGIFRLAPDKDACNIAKRQIDTGTFTNVSDPNIIANLIKVFFRDLPKQLFSNIPVELIANCDDEEDALQIMNSMTEPEKSLFKWLVDLCVEIANHSDRNKMTAQNLAIVLAPNLFLTDSMDPMEGLMFSQKVAHFVHKSVSMAESVSNPLSPRSAVPVPTTHQHF